MIEYVGLEPRLVDEVVHLEAVAMFEHVFRGVEAEKLRRQGYTIPKGGGPGDPAEDEFALTEAGHSAVCWTRGRPDEARYTGTPDTQARAFPAVQAFLGVELRPGERVPVHVAEKLRRLEVARNREWFGASFRCIKREVFRRKVRREVAQ